MNIGFIGLGIMGKPMAKNVLKAHYNIIVSSRKPDTNKEMEEAGAVVVLSLQELAAKSDMIVMMLPDSPEVKEIMMGNDGIMEQIKPGTIVIDMSSIAPNVSKDVYQTLRVKGIHYLDAPVSGGEPKAVDGTLSVMVGGDEVIFEKCLSVLQTMAKSVVRVGAIGAGNSTKLANQMIVALNIAAVSEAFVMAEKMGVDTDLVYQAIRGGLAGSAVMDAKVPLMLDRNFQPGFTLNLHVKDLKNAMETLDDMDLDLPLTTSVNDVLNSLVEDGHGEEDHSAMVKHYEKLADVVVDKKK